MATNTPDSTFPIANVAYCVFTLFPDATTNWFVVSTARTLLPSTALTLRAVVVSSFCGLTIKLSSDKKAQEAVPSPSLIFLVVVSTPLFELSTCSKSLYVFANVFPVKLIILLS